MNKIIAALDGLKYAQSTTQYATMLARQTGAHLVGIFLDDMTYHSFRVYDILKEKGDPARKIEALEVKDKATRNKAVQQFSRTCGSAGVNYSVHHDRKIAIQELIHESIYADCLVISMKETFTHYEEKTPTRFIRELLTNAQCPVLLVPPRYREVEKLVMLYDGEPSSVHAIKMFSYMLPRLTAEMQAEVLSIKNANNDLHLPDNKLMKEFMKRHFPVAKYRVMRGVAEDEIVDYLKKQEENCLVVLGAYQRSSVSRWFRSSMADRLMKQVKSPLFIAHK